MWLSLCADLGGFRTEGDLIQKWGGGGCFPHPIPSACRLWSVNLYFILFFLSCFAFTCRDFIWYLFIKGSFGAQPSWAKPDLEKGHSEKTRIQNKSLWRLSVFGIIIIKKSEISHWNGCPQNNHNCFLCSWKTITMKWIIRVWLTNNTPNQGASHNVVLGKCVCVFCSLSGIKCEKWSQRTLEAFLKPWAPPCGEHNLQHSWAWLGLLPQSPVSHFRTERKGLWKVPCLAENIGGALILTWKLMPFWRDGLALSHLGS